MSKFAVIQTGGKQYCVRENSVIDIEIRDGYAEGDSIDFDEVLLVDDGKDTIVGSPYIAGKKVRGTVEKIGRGKKISVIRFRSKSNYRRHYGHRQPFFRVKITGVA